MKVCALCGEQVNDDVVACSKGHGVFETPRKKTARVDHLATEKQLLRAKFPDYSEYEILFLADEIARMALVEHIQVDITFLNSVVDKIELLHKSWQEQEAQRQEDERKQIELREKREQEEQQKKVEEQRQQEQQKHEEEQREREAEQRRLEIDRQMEELWKRKEELRKEEQRKADEKERPLRETRWKQEEEQRREELEKRRKEKEEQERQRREEQQRLEAQQQQEWQLFVQSTNLEHIVTHFRGNNPMIPQADIVQLLIDALDVAGYGHLQNTRSNMTIDRVYSDNKSFWTDALERRLFQGMRIQLNRFFVSEWLPYSPGRYFTSESGASRELAKQHIDRVRREYLPQGK